MNSIAARARPTWAAGRFGLKAEFTRAGILPRATESFSDDQLKLVQQARRYKAAAVDWQPHRPVGDQR